MSRQAWLRYPGDTLSVIFANEHDPAIEAFTPHENHSRATVRATRKALGAAEMRPRQFLTAAVAKRLILPFKSAIAPWAYRVRRFVERKISHGLYSHWHTVQVFGFIFLNRRFSFV